jgi:hypothetical protein
MTARGGRDGSAQGTDARPARRTPDTDLLASVGRNLASVYEELLRQPMPPHIADLVERIGDGRGLRPAGVRDGA